MKCIRCGSEENEINTYGYKIITKCKQCGRIIQKEIDQEKLIQYREEHKEEIEEEERKQDLIDKKNDAQGDELNNLELTELIGDLMYEVDQLKLGIGE